jgi:ABC-type arginine transport system permease subunit
MCIALQHVQAKAIFQWVVAFGRGFSSLPHIIVNALPSLANLWQMIVISF